MKSRMGLALGSITRPLRIIGLQPMPQRKCGLAAIPLRSRLTSSNEEDSEIVERPGMKAG